MRLTIVKPKKQKTPVAVGAGEGGGGEDPELTDGEARWRARAGPARRALDRRPARRARPVGPPEKPVAFPLGA